MFIAWQDLATNPYLQHMLENYSNLMYNNLATQRRGAQQLPMQNGGGGGSSGRPSGGSLGGGSGQEKAPAARGGPSWC